jgi:hypothetical protein
MSGNPKKRFWQPAVLSLLFLFLLNSCIGVSMDIQMGRNGSGRIVMEYRISNMAEALGRLDGNENWPVIPTGRLDWERSVARIGGMRLVSFSSRERAQDTFINVTLDYDNTEALLKFLDHSGTRTSLKSNRLNIILNEPISSQINSDLLELLRQQSAGYKVSVSFSAQGNSVLTVTDGTGRETSVPANAEIIPSGRKVSLSIDTAEILSLAQGLGISVSW